ncbi:deoxyuridine 5'-triphosphate nucleotidohydrolase [Candidatus Woesearchaeota archaeon]|nr:deoxyuridine 5'-triphosphate nucleotidohydrolase [Candidatus Woesearchaeota archaeon]
MLNKKQIKKLIEDNKLIENYIDLETQLTPNGFDFSAEKIFRIKGKGKLDFSNSERVLPKVEEIIPENSWWFLEKGAYKIRTNEIINLPNNLIAVSFPRSSLLRMNAFTQHGVWDAGFKGKSEFILIVENEQGIEIKENARINQLIFVPIDESEAYDGIYKNIK